MRFRGIATAWSAAKEVIVNSRLRRSRPTDGLPHRSRRGGVVAPSRQFRRSMPAALGSEARRPPRQTAESAGGREHNCSRETRAFAARTPTPTVAAPIVQRLADNLRDRRKLRRLDDTTMPLRRYRQVHRLVRQRPAKQVDFPQPPFAVGLAATIVRNIEQVAHHRRRLSTVGRSYWGYQVYSTCCKGMQAPRLLQTGVRQLVARELLRHAGQSQSSNRYSSGARRAMRIPSPTIRRNIAGTINTTRNANMMRK